MDNIRQVCPQCNGKGTAYVEHGNTLRLERCPLCRGAGTAKIHEATQWYVQNVRSVRHQHKQEEVIDG